MASGCRALLSGVSKPPTTMGFMKASFPGIYTHIFQKGCYLDVLIPLARTVYTYGDRREL